MKKIIVEDSNEGLVSLLGETVLLMCSNYFYTGTLAGVNDTCVKLDNCSIVYETGPWSEKSWKDSQIVGDAHYINTDHIESYRVVEW